MFSGLLLGLLLWQDKAGEVARAEQLHEQGVREFEAGRFEAGRKAILESLAIHTRWGVGESRIINLRMLAFGHDGAGERQRAIGYYERALALAREQKNTRLEASTLRDLGTLHYNLDENAKALTYLEQSLALQRTLAKAPVLAATIYSLGELYRYQGGVAKARSYLEEALRIARESGTRNVEADALSSLAMLESKDRRFPEAREKLESALRIRMETKDARGEASTRARLGIYFDATGDRAQALTFLRAAAAKFAEVKYRGGEAFARQSLAMVERKAGNLETAIAEMLRAVEIAESLRQKLSDGDLRSTYIGYVQNRYEFLIDAMLEADKGNPARAFAMSERARARGLVEALGSPSLPAMPLDRIQAEVLDAGTVLLEYSLGERASHLFVVSRGGITHRALPGRVPLEAMARTAYERFRTPGQPADTAALRAMLIGNVDAKRLVVVADGALQYLPFAALTPGVPVVTAPSAAAIAAMRKTRGARPERELAIFSDPRVPALARLPFAKTEAAHIVNLAGGRAVYSASGDGATRQAVLDHPARIMHFAAHSLLDTERPDRTEIALSGEPLRLRDVAGLRLDDSLIVLSACQTALGREMKREGLLGLAYAFQQAGASQVLASLWKVDDRATAELMKHFYEGLLRQGLRAPEALTAAQQTLARSARWPHPFYWAGFTIQGDWR